MTNQCEVNKRFSEIIQTSLPKWNEAINYYESKLRDFPVPAFTEARDVLSHTFDLFIGIEDEENIDKNLIEIKEHFRRGIIETYQAVYDDEMAQLYQYYGKFQRKARHFERLLFLYKVHKPIHDKILSVMKASQDLWIEGRNSKSNEINTTEFSRSIELFKEAYEKILGIKEDIFALWNNYYQRSTIGIIIVVALIVLLASIKL